MTTRIRPAVYDDLEDVLAIEARAFSSPWSKDDFVRELERTRGLFLVAIHDREVIGYLVQWYFMDEVHIANLAVRSTWQKHGVATRLIQGALNSAGGFSCAVLEVRKSNHAARNLYQKLGFEETGIRRGYYSDSKEDAVIMRKWLTGNPG